MLDLSKDEKVTCPPELQRRRKHFLPRWSGWGRGDFAPMEPEGEDNVKDWFKA